MAQVIPIAVYIVMGLVVAVLGAGVVSMLRGGRFNRRYGNKLMRWRVGLQALAIALLAFLIFVVQRSP